MEVVWPNYIEKGSLIWALLNHMLISCLEVLAQALAQQLENSCWLVLCSFS